MKTLSELFGKGSIDTIGKAHRSAMDAAPKGSKEKTFHTIARNRASRIKNTITGKSPVGKPSVSNAVKYGQEDRVQMQLAKRSAQVAKRMDQVDEGMGNVLIQKDHATHETRSRIWPGKSIEHKMPTMYHTSEESAKSHIASLKKKYGAKEVHCVMKKLGESADQVDEANWIAGAIKHPGAEKRAAKSAGMSTHAYMEKEKNAPGKAGERARLGLTLSKMHHEEADLEAAKHAVNQDMVKKLNLKARKDREDKIRNSRSGWDKPHKEETNLTEISCATKSSYKEKASKDFENQVNKRFDSNSTENEKKNAIRKMRNRAKGVDKVRFEEFITEDHKVIGAHSTASGSKYELHAHNQGHSSEWHAIIKTNHKGEPCRSCVHTGTPKYIYKKWSDVKVKTMREEWTKEEEPKKDLHPQTSWWKNHPDKLMSAVYWHKSQLPPSDRKKKHENYQNIVSQLHKRHPAPAEEYKKHMSHYATNESVNESELDTKGRKKSLTTFERLQRKTTNYLLNRDNNIAAHARQGMSTQEIAKHMNVHHAIVTAVVGAEAGRVKKEEFDPSEKRKLRQMDYRKSTRSKEDIEARYDRAYKAADEREAVVKARKAAQKTYKEETELDERHSFVSNRPHLRKFKDDMGDKIWGSEKKKKWKNPLSKPENERVDMYKRAGNAERIKEDALDEISRNKLDRYMDKSENDSSHHHYNLATGRVPPHKQREVERKFKNREKGLKTADKKFDKSAVVPATEAIDFAKLAKKVHTKAISGWVKNNNKGFAELAQKGKGIKTND